MSVQDQSSHLHVPPMKLSVDKTSGAPGCPPPPISLNLVRARDRNISYRRDSSFLVKSLSRQLIKRIGVVVKSLPTVLVEECTKSRVKSEPLRYCSSKGLEG